MTIFSRIVAGEIPCYKIAEDEQFFAFLDISPLAKGHTLVIPKREEDYIFDLTDEEIAGLQAELSHYRDSVAVESLKPAHGFYYNTATIINNSTNSINNYITLDKGSNEGIKEGMGVFGTDGIVGIVYTTSQNFSIVVPLLNSKSNVSCRVKGTNNFSPLQWKGGDTRHSYMVDLPRHSTVETGDTVVTSGFSSIFPGDMPVGKIVKIEDTADGMFYRAKIELFTDFSTISRVFLVGNEDKQELEILEKSTKKQ